MCKGRLLSTTAHHIGNVSSRGRSQGSLGVENHRNGTDRATERSGPCNGTKRTVERNGTDRFMPFLGKRCRHATQTERTVFITFFRRVPYMPGRQPAL